MSDIDQRDPEQITQSVAQMRSGLFAKIGTLELALKGEVKDAKIYVQEKVEQVKNTFDLPHQIKRHPLFCVGGAMLCGFLLGESGSTHNEAALASSNTLNSNLQIRASGLASNSTQKSKLLSEQFAPEISQLKTLVLEALLSPLRELAKNNAPKKMEAQINQILDVLIEKI